MIEKQTLEFEAVNDLKANFDNIYLKEDPRDYYRVLHGLDYIIPDVAKGVFRDTIASLQKIRRRPIKVLDLGCSYGNNAALIRYPLDIDRLAQRYRDLDVAGVDSSELIRLDRHYFSSWPRSDVEVVGLDISAPAIRYAKSVGLLDDGAAIDLESKPVNDATRKLLQGVDLIISTGCVGYVTDRTFSKILSSIDGPQPWVASFVLRMFPYDKIMSLFSEAGLITERLDGVTFVQRRFRSAEECADVLQALAQRKIKTTGKEDEGLYHAELFVSRPAADHKNVRLEEVASVTVGGDRNFGRRWHRTPDDEIRLGR